MSETETREVAHYEGARQSENLLQQVIAAAQNPAIDADKMKLLADLVNSQQDREREIEFNQSKNAAIMEMPVITKDGRIVIRKPGEAERQQGRFARWEDIDRVVRPILASHDLALSFDISERAGGGMTVTPILTHANGYTQRGGGFPVPPENSGSKNAAQAMGSAATYGKRYAGCAMLNIVTEGLDDDGRGGQAVLVTLPFEREQVVMREAEAAGQAGTYVEWFSRQSPKDRAWMISSGNHARLGGQPALPTATPTPADAAIDEPPAKTDQRQEPTSGPEPTAKPTTAKRTPRQWVDALRADLAKCQTVGFLDEYMEEARDSLEKLKASNEALWQETQDAYRDRRAAIEDGRLV